MRLGLRETASEGPTVLHIQFCSLSNNSKWQLGAPADMTTVFHAWSYDRSTETPSNLRKKKFHQTNQGSNFLGGGFSNRASLSAWIHFGRENQAQHLKRWYFIKNRIIHFPINSTSVIRPLKQNYTSFSCIEINKPFHAPVNSALQIRFKFRSQFPLLLQVTY